MTLEAFEQSIEQHRKPPAEISVYLQSLWYDAKGDWDKAHEMIQDVEDETSFWIHAYLHRKEGDSWNADYWYRKAGKAKPDASLKEEWKEISSILLNA